MHETVVKLSYSTLILAGNTISNYWFIPLSRWIPVYADKNENLAVMSIGFLLKSNTDAVVWRGPKKNGNYLHTLYMDRLERFVIL